MTVSRTNLVLDFSPLTGAFAFACAFDFAVGFDADLAVPDATDFFPADLTEVLATVFTLVADAVVLATLLWLALWRAADLAVGCLAGVSAWSGLWGSVNVLSFVGSID